MTDKTRAEILLEENEDFIRKYVNGFIARGKGSLSHIREDLFQEARLAFWLWATKNDKGTRLNPLNSLIYMKKALYKTAAGDTGVKIKSDNLKTYYKTMRVIGFEEFLVFGFSDVADIDYKIDLELWKKTLNTKHLKILQLKEQGYTPSDIAQILSLPVGNVEKSLYSDIRNSYNKYFGIKDSTKMEGSHVA